MHGAPGGTDMRVLCSREYKCKIIVLPERTKVREHGTERRERWGRLSMALQMDMTLQTHREADTNTLTIIPVTDTTIGTCLLNILPSLLTKPILFSFSST